MQLFPSPFPSPWESPLSGRQKHTPKAVSTSDKRSFKDILVAQLRKDMGQHDWQTRASQSFSALLLHVQTTFPQQALLNACSAEEAHVGKTFLTCCGRIT